MALQSTGSPITNVMSSIRFRQSRPRQRIRLTFREFFKRKARDLGLEQTVVVQFRLEMEEDGPEPDGRAVHEHELAGNDDRPFLLQGLMHPERLASPIFRGFDAIRDRAHPILKERSIDKP